MTILFVCTGNTCRSPMAEHLLKKILKKNGVKVASAGTSVISSTQIPSVMLEILAKEEIDISCHRARQLTREIIDEASLVLAMESCHKRNILYYYPQSSGKVFLLKEFIGEGEIGIADPFGGSKEAYMRAFSQIKEAVEKLRKKVLNDCLR